MCDAYKKEVETCIAEIKTLGCKVRYSCIGFSASHDAVQMNQIARSGTEQGNFIFVDTKNDDYPVKIAEALGESFDIAQGSDSTVKFRIENTQEDYKILAPCIILKTQIDVNCSFQQVLKTALINQFLKVTVVTKKAEHECEFQLETNEEPQTEMLIKARLKLNQKRLFDYIQDFQKKPSAERKTIYDVIMAVAKHIDQEHDVILQIKDEAVRTDMKEVFIQFKNQITTMSNALNKYKEDLDNRTLAELNDAAYKFSTFALLT